MHSPHDVSSLAEQTGIRNIFSQSTRIVDTSLHAYKERMEEQTLQYKLYVYIRGQET